MLIEFKVANFRSIREEQTLSLVANNADVELADGVIERELPGLSGVRFLRGAAIYGANASGKSNVLEALYYLVLFIDRSATRLQPGDSTEVQPFKLDEQSKKQPTKFEITFAINSTRYVFGLSLVAERVIEEYLIAYPKGTPQRWYSRRYDSGTKSYKWSRPAVGFKHDKSLQDKTRENSLFLSVAPQFNHPQLTPIFNWFRSGFEFLSLTQDILDPEITVGLLAKSNHRTSLLKLLRGADIGVDGVKIQAKEIDYKSLIPHLSPVALAELEEKRKLDFFEELEFRLTHSVSGSDPITLDFDEEESAGTQRFFKLIGPWFNILNHGYTVFIDEIETSLHPVLVRELLKLVFSKESNPKGAQVIFTTHNPLLLDKTLMRRDQIWFTEKSPEGATHLYPLTDYHPRKDEALTKGYLAGRYGGIPFIPEGLQL